MLRAKAIKLLSNKFFLTLLFVAFFCVTRIPYLGRDAINPDAVNWHYRSEQFVVGLKNGIWEKTYQHYHPGVTLMWVMGSTVEIARQIDPALRVYNHENFLFLHSVAKYSLVFVQLGLTLGVLYVFSLILGFKKSLIITSFFSLEPFFIGNSRLLHMDVLLTLFLALGLGLAYLGIFEDKNFKRNLAFSGIFLSFAFLTKSVAIGALLFVPGISVLVHLKNPKKLLKTILWFLAPYIITLFVFFPALWVAPLSTLWNMFDEVERVGIRKGHGQIFFGAYTRDPGMFFYPLTLYLKSSPVMILGLALFIYSLFKFRPLLKSADFSFFGFLTLFFAGYFLVMTISSKKIDRYIIPAFPYFCFMSYLGFERIAFAKLKNIVLAVGLVLLLILNFVFYPFQFTYATPLVGGLRNADKIIGQKPFGIGIPDLKDLVLDKYGSYPSLGFYDVKPMRTIYKASEIADVEINGISDYDLLILGPGEPTPEEVLESDVTFNLDETVEINGLEYWRIYVKENFLTE